MDVIRELVLANDKPRAEITLDVEILEVSRGRVQEAGAQSHKLQIGVIFSPEERRRTATAALQPEHGHSGGQHVRLLPGGAVGGGGFPRDRWQQQLLANTTLRGAEGTPLTLKVGADEPYLTTTFAPLAGGGANVNPLSSYSFRTVGISVQATPRLADSGDIMLDLVMSNDTLGPLRVVGDTTAPSFPTRWVTAASLARRRIASARGASAGRGAAPDEGFPA